MERGFEEEGEKEGCVGRLMKEKERGKKGTSGGAMMGDKWAMDKRFMCIGE